MLNFSVLVLFGCTIPRGNLFFFGNERQPSRSPAQPPPCPISVLSLWASSSHIPGGNSPSSFSQPTSQVPHHADANSLRFHQLRYISNFLFSPYNGFLTANCLLSVGWSKALGWKKGVYRQEAGPVWGFISAKLSCCSRGTNCSWAVNARLEEQLP